ncbi:MAG: GNAT family N-acetyltransferase [Clostridia bacterium]|nr:GNAT family N-acetyltransferase [Clostridia bacterium]
MLIRPLSSSDHEALLALWNAVAPEALCLPLARDDRRMSLSRTGAVRLGAEDDSLEGFLCGTVGGEWAWLDLVLVAREKRRQGIGRALVEAFEAQVRAAGVRGVRVGGSPLDIAWRLPRTGGHEHPHLPGVPVGFPAFPYQSYFHRGADFLKACGYAERTRVMAMDCALGLGHGPVAELAGQRGYALRRAGIEFLDRPPADGALRYDALCDHVGSEYWRAALKTELEAWRAGKPNADPRFWPDGRQPLGPRPLLMAVDGGEVVGFTGPVDVQRNRRGWFTGLCVDPAYQRRGIGRVLFEALMLTLADEGAEYMTLYTGEGNPARRLYEREGFTARQTFALLGKEWEDRHDA